MHGKMKGYNFPFKFSTVNVSAIIKYVMDVGDSVLKIGTRVSSQTY